MKLPKTAAAFSDFPISSKQKDSLQKFPKGILFAFSGMFFLLTLLVLFQSKEPFGVAAVVAYVSCLTLTILLFSVPYFASYFINYYQKLHQIEEAILLLSDQRGIKVATVDEISTLPPYSAVTAIADGSHSGQSDEEAESKDGVFFADPGEDHMETDGQKDSSIEEPDESVSRSNEDADGASQVEDVSEKPKKSPPGKSKKRNSGLSSEDEFQLSLFDQAPSEEEAEELGGIPVLSGKNGDEIQTTEVHAYLLLDASKKLFIRGDAPFSWDAGTELNLLDVGKFATDKFSIESPIQVKFLINDSEKKMSELFEIEPKVLNECYPEV